MRLKLSLLVVLIVRSSSCLLLENEAMSSSAYVREYPVLVRITVVAILSMISSSLVSILALVANSIRGSTWPPF